MEASMREGSGLATFRRSGEEEEEDAASSSAEEDLFNLAPLRRRPRLA